MPIPMSVRMILLMLGLPCLLPAPAMASRRHDQREIRRLVGDRIGAARLAWTERRPELLVGPGPDTLVMFRTPDGGVVTRGELMEDLSARMALVTRIDTLSEVIERIDVRADSAVVLTSQRFVRWIRLPDSPERQRISQVTHRQVFRRALGRWRTAGPVQEIDPRARWADEPPARP